MPEIATNIIAWVVSVALIVSIVAVSLTIIATCMRAVYIIMRTGWRLAVQGVRNVHAMFTPGEGSHRPGRGRHAVGAPLAEPVAADGAGWEPEHVNQSTGEVTSFVWRGGR